MSDRDRLIELIKQGENNTPCTKNEDIDCTSVKCTDCVRESIADYLLANGVIVLPFKIGQSVYDISEFMNGSYAPEMYEMKGNELNIELNKAGEYIFTYDGMYIYPEDMGRSVFLTKEEAEKALAERSGNNAKM